MVIIAVNSYRNVKDGKAEQRKIYLKNNFIPWANPSITKML